MFWSAFDTHLFKLFASVRMFLHRHPRAALEAFLVNGSLLLMALLLFFLPFFQRSQHAYLWLAGLAATLGILLLCTAASGRINGYHFLHDFWMKLAMGMMLTLSALLVIAAYLHLS
jgi:hypothetical protein